MTGRQGPLGALLRDFGTYGLGDMLAKAAAFLTIPVYTRIFPPAEYGVWMAVLAAVNMVNAVLLLGADSAFARHWFELRSQEERRVLTTTVLAFLGAWTLAGTLLLLPAAPWMSAALFGDPVHAPLFVLAVLSTPLALVNVLCGQVLRNQFASRRFVALNVVWTVLSVGLSLGGVLVLGLGLVGVLGGVLAANVVMLPLRLWSVRGMLGPAVSWARMRAMMAYGLPLVPAALAYWAFTTSDRFLLARLSTLDQLGLYGLAFTLVSVLTFLNGALGQAWSPRAFQMREEQPEDAPAFFGQVCTYIVVGFGALCVAAAALAPEMLALMAPGSFAGAAAAVGPLGLSVLALATTQVTAAGISISKRTRYIATYAWMAAVLNIGLNLLLIPAWGMVGAAWATAAAYGALSLAYLARSQRLWAVRYEARPTVAALLLTVAFVVAAPLLPDVGLLAGLAMKAAFCAAWLAALVAAGAVGRRELDALAGWWRGLREPAPRAGAKTVEP